MIAFAISAYRSTTPPSPFLSHLDQNLKIYSSSTTPLLSLKLSRSSQLLRFNSQPRGIVALGMQLYPHPVVDDLCATVISGAIALSTLKVWQETAKRDIFDRVSYYVSIILSVRSLFC